MQTELIFASRLGRKLKGIIGLLMAGSMIGCASDGYLEEPPLSTAELCAEYANNPDGDTVVVARDTSTSSGVAAVGVTASGGLQDWAAIVGPGAATSRGGALVAKGGATSVDMKPCAPSALQN
ncbi:MAG: hypothetical protein AAF668_09565 [Pseudomonadota bacterium]